MPRRIHDGIKKRCDCGKRQWPKCSHPWWFGFHFAGKEHRYSLDKVALARGEHPPVSKSEAMTWRDRLRNEIRAGTFREAPPAPAPATKLTFGDVCDVYLERHVRKPTRRPKGRLQMETNVRLLRRAEIPAAHGASVKLESKPIAEITKADVEAVRLWRRKEQAASGRSPSVKGGECGTNRLLSRLRHVFSWAISEGYLNDTPFKRGPVTVVKMETGAESARTRRLEPATVLPDGTVRESEEARLLKHAGPHLRALIVAALTTGCRLGELLSLQWSQVRRDERGGLWLVLHAEKTKTSTTRVIPVGPRLRAELDMRRHAPDGKEHPPSAFVFGDETGGQVKSIRRAWEVAVLKAHGYTPSWDGRAGGKNRPRLSRESQAALRAINLHFHDLRRQFACTLLESGADLHDVRDFLGHANITTTSRYLQSTPVRLARVIERMEEMAAGFGQSSHTAPLAASDQRQSDDADSAGKLLN